MKHSDMCAQLQAWANEYQRIADVQMSVPPKLWMFIASRLAEMTDSSVESHPNEITMHLAGNPRKVRVTGTRSGLLCYEFADGAVGMGMCKIEDIPDRSKLTQILERLHQEGKA